MYHLNKYKQSIARFALPHSTHTLFDWVMHIGQHFGIAHGTVFVLGSRYCTGEVRIEWARWVILP